MYTCPLINKLCGGLFTLNTGKPVHETGGEKWNYVTVREDAHMFWWLYYTTAAVQSYTDRPLIMWLQVRGGTNPGYKASHL